MYTFWEQCVKPCRLFIVDPEYCGFVVILWIPKKRVLSAPPTWRSTALSSAAGWAERS